MHGIVMANAWHIENKNLTIWVEIKPISRESRLDYFNTISETQQATIKKFPWLNSVIFLLIGAGIVYGVFKHQKSKEKKQLKTQVINNNFDLYSKPV